MKIVVVGSGAMGGWLISHLSLLHEIYWWDPYIPARDAPLMGLRLDSPEALSRIEPDLVINCVTLSRTIPVFEGLLPYLPRWTILADITSIKGSLPQWYRRTGRPFLSFHPLFGPLFSTHGRQTVRNMLLISESARQAGLWLKETFDSPSFRIREISFEDHDRAMRTTLGLPMLLSLLGLELLPEDICLGTGLEAFLKHGQSVLKESPDLLSAVLPHALSSDLPSQISRILGEWRQEADRGSLIDRLRHSLPRKVIPLEQGGGRAVS